MKGIKSMRGFAHLAACMICAGLLTLAAPLAAEENPSVTAVKAGRLIDVKSGKVLTDQIILIEHERITQMGTAKNVAIPDGAKVVDLSGATVLPGLIDAHVHLTSSHNDHGYKSLGNSVPWEAIQGVAHAKKTLMAGFTTVRNVGAGGYADVALRDSIAAGIVPGPRMRASGPSLGITGGHCDSNLLPSEYQHKAEGVADGPWAVRAKVREVKKYGADVIKFCGTGGVLSKGTQIGAQQFAYEEMKAIVDEAKLLGLKVAVHAHGADGIKTAIRAGVDSVEHASLIDAEGIRMAKKAGTYLSMDIYVSDFILTEGEAAGILEESLAKERTVGRAQRESFQRAVKAGVKMAFGSDAGVYPHGDNGRQFAYMVQWGMTPMQAIQAATVNGAHLLGLSDDVGALEVGRYADLIAVTGDPLGDIKLLESIPFVMKGGAVYKDEF